MRTMIGRIMTAGPHNQTHEDTISVYFVPAVRICRPVCLSASGSQCPCLSSPGMSRANASWYVGDTTAYAASVPDIA
eukprot:1604103-Rhodomonas_salina.2